MTKVCSKYYSFLSINGEIISHDILKVNKIEKDNGSENVQPRHKPCFGYSNTGNILSVDYIWFVLLSHPV